jgi:hypothetical protein
MKEYFAPQAGSTSFTCPLCGVLARQYFFSNGPQLGNGNNYTSSDPIATSICEHCQDYCLWHNGKLIYPDTGLAPLPSADMPDAVRRIYEEAAGISSKSPRGAAALLRLAVQNLCLELSGKNNINEAIAEPVKQGLPPRIQQALDIVRVIGNNAVHPGQIDVDNEKTVMSLFELLNVICEYIITMPAKVSDLYTDLPEASRKAIDKRDGKT